jgi:hypothetical protein
LAAEWFSARFTRWPENFTLHWFTSLSMPMFISLKLIFQYGKKPPVKIFSTKKTGSAIPIWI